MQKDETKRLAPTPKTMKKLFALSGNICAFNDGKNNCSNLIIDSSGVVIGEICHIEAAEGNGARFRRDMSDEDRRSFENLILLCPICHKIIDDNKDKYDINFLKKMKKDHESKFLNPEDKILNTLNDSTDLHHAIRPKNLKNLNVIAGWNHNDEELMYELKLLNAVIDNLEIIPKETLSYLSNIIERYNKIKDYRKIKQINEYRTYICIPSEDIQTSFKLDSQNYAKVIKNLELYDLAHLDIYSHFDELEQEILCINNLNFDFPFWLNLVEVSQKEGISLAEIIADLNFSCLDL